MLFRSDDEGNTPLSLAAIEGHEPIVKLLLNRQDVNPDKPDNEGRTPLWWAASQGHELVVRQLLSREDVNPDVPDNHDVTPLCDASTSGHERVVRQLLDRGDATPRELDNEGNTPPSGSVIGRQELALNPSATKTPPPSLTTMTSPHFRGLRFERMRQWLSKAWAVKTPNPAKKAVKAGLLSRRVFRRGAK